MADWHWEPVTDDLLDGLPPAALAAVRQVAEELTDEGAPHARAANPASRLSWPASRRITTGYLAALLRACRPAPAVPPAGRAPAAPPGLAEPLADRETDVLRLIAASRSNQRIAHGLVVTLDTVKKHVSHILGKLGAAPERVVLYLC